MEEIRYIEIVAQYQDMVYRIALHDCRNSQEYLKHWLVHVTVNECKRLIVSPWKKSFWSRHWGYVREKSFQHSDLAFQST